MFFWFSSCQISTLNIYIYHISLLSFKMEPKNMKDSKRILTFILGPYLNLANSLSQFAYITKLRGKKPKKKKPLIESAQDIVDNTRQCQ
jgi:hypothetical protein